MRRTVTAIQRLFRGVVEIGRQYVGGGRLVWRAERQEKSVSCFLFNVPFFPSFSRIHVFLLFAFLSFFPFVDRVL